MHWQFPLLYQSNFPFLPYPFLHSSYVYCLHCLSPIVSPWMLVYLIIINITSLITSCMHMQFITPIGSQYPWLLTNTCFRLVPHVKQHEIYDNIHMAYVYGLNLGLAFFISTKELLAGLHDTSSCFYWHKNSINKNNYTIKLC